MRGLRPHVGDHYLSDGTEYGRTAWRCVIAYVASLSGPTTDLEKAQIGLGLIAVNRGVATSAQELYVALEHARGTVETSGAISLDRSFGLLAHTMGNHNTVAGHFEDALTFCRKAGYPPELAWSLCDYAEMLLDASTNSPTSRGQAARTD